MPLRQPFCARIRVLQFGDGMLPVLSLANRTARIEPRQFSSGRDAKYSRELYSQWADE